MPDLGIGEYVGAFLIEGMTDVEAGSAIFSGVTAIVNGAIYAGAMYGLGAAYQALNKQSAPAMTNRIALVKSSTATRKIIYGEVRASGALVFVNSTGANNAYLHMVVALAGHSCEEIGTIYFNETPMPSDTSIFSSPVFDPNKTDYEVGNIVYADSCVIKGAYTNNVNNTSLGSGAAYQRTDVIWSAIGNPPITDQNSWRIVGAEKYFSASLPDSSTWTVVQSGTTLSYPTDSNGNYIAPAGIYIVAYSGNSDSDPGTTYTAYQVPSPVNTPVVTINRHLGTLDQVADATLITNCPDYWTSAHKLTGVTYIYVMLTYNPALWQTGIPNISAIIKGKNDIYDPRTVNAGSFVIGQQYAINTIGTTNFTSIGRIGANELFTATGVGSGTGSANPVGYSTNWALCVADYITSPLGLNAPQAELDSAAWIAAANISDEQLQVGGPTYTSFKTLSNYYQARYTCNGTIDTGNTPMDILTNICSAGAGSVVWTGGLYRIFAGAYSSPVWNLTESDLRDAITLHPRVGKQDLFNTVTGTYYDPNQYYQATNFIPQTNSSWVIQDGGTANLVDGNWIYTGQLIRNVEMPFTNDPFEAQRTALLTLKRARQGMIIDFPAKYTALPINVNDIVTVSIALLGLVDAEFRVINWKMGADGAGIDLVMQQESSDSYIFDPANQSPISYAPNTNLPSPWNVATPTGLKVAETLYSTNTPSIILTKVTLDWNAIADSSITYRLLLNNVAAGGNIVGNSYVFDDLTPGAYTFTLQAVNGIGAVSAPFTVAYTVTGKTDGPANVSGFSATLAKGQILLAWTPLTEADVDVYEIQIGNTWGSGNAVLIQNYTANSFSYVPSHSGTINYLIKAVNTTGIFSVSATSTSITISGAAAPTAISGTPILQGIDLVVTYANTADINYCEIWAATTNNRASASLIGITRNGKFTHTGLGNAASRYYWARTVNVYAENSAWYPSGATSGVLEISVSDPSAVLTLLNAGITSPSLTAYLAGAIPMLQLLDTGSPAFTSAAALSSAAASTLTGLQRAASGVITQGSQVANVAAAIASANSNLTTLNATVAGLLTNNYDPTIAYSLNQYVRYSDGNVYQCILATTAGINPTNPTYWVSASNISTLISSIQANVVTLNSEIATTVSTTTYNTEVGNLVAATSAVAQTASNINSKVTATTVAFLGGEEFDPTVRYSTGTNVVVTDPTTHATLQYQCSATLPLPPTGTLPASDGAHWTLVASTGRLVTAESNISQNASAITLSNQTITGPLAFLSTAAKNSASIMTIADLPPGINTRISSTTIKADSAIATIALQASMIDSLTGRVSNAEVNIDGANAAILLSASVTSVDAVAATAATGIANAAAAQAAATAAQSTATTAVTNAATATANAATANSLLADIANDNKLTPVEKSQVLNEWNIIVAEKSGFDTLAASYSLSTTTYDTDYSALSSYITPLLSDLTTTSNIIGSTFRRYFANYYNDRTDILNAAALSAKSLANAAQAQANTATTNAAAAQSTANTAVANAATAQSSANTANIELSNIASDNMLSAGEKPAVLLDYTNIINEQSGIDAQATSFAITTEKTAYDSAVSTLTTYLGILTGWNTIPGTDVVIVGTTFRTNFANVYSTRQTLLNKISTVAKAAADAAQGTATSAASSALTANNLLADIANDDKLTPSEKSATLNIWNVIVAEKSNIDAEASAFSVSSTSYDLYYTALSSYITPLLATLTSTDTIVGSDFRTYFSNYYTSRTALLNAISTAGKNAAQSSTTSSAYVLANAANGSVTIQSEYILGPPAFSALAASNSAAIFNVSDIPVGMNARLSLTTIKADAANSVIQLQSSMIDSLTGRMNTAEIDISGVNAAITLTATSAAGALAGQVTILSDMIGLKLNANGTAGPGLAIGWTDDTHTKSTVEVDSDTFSVGNSAELLAGVPVFAIGNVNGLRTIGINGADLIIDGSITATAIDTSTLLIGSNIFMAPDATISWASVSKLGAALSDVDSSASTKLSGIAAGATKNTVTYSSSAPSSPTDGDLWCDTSVNPNVWKARVSSAWQITANYVTNTTQVTDGANLGGTSLWSGVSGTGKPSDNATVGAVWGTNLSSVPSNISAAVTAGTAILNSDSTLQGQITTAAGTSTYSGISSLPRNIATAGSSPSVSLLNNAITVDGSGNIQGIGTGNSTTVSNQMVTIDVNGKLVGVGTADIVVDNSKVTLTSLSAMPLNAATPTNIGSNWIYTGTLTAAQVNAVAIDANSITTGDLTAVGIKTKASTSVQRIEIDTSTDTFNFYEAGVGASPAVTIQAASSITGCIYVNTVFIGILSHGDLAGMWATGGTNGAGAVLSGGKFGAEVGAGYAGSILLGSLSSDPTGSNCVEGAMYYNSVTHQFKGYNGVVWSVLG